MIKKTEKKTEEVKSDKVEKPKAKKKNKIKT